jgi:catechol 2,3-dioxygenase-like lactoylglutathione lyase family enzyme
MLSQRPVHTTIPASDIERAKRFYGETLGFPIRLEGPGGVMFEGAEGTRFVVYPSPNAGASPNTLMGFDVDDIESEVRELTARGVVFEQYDFPGMKTDELGIATAGPTRSAWFKDTEGNILGVVELPD